MNDAGVVVRESVPSSDTVRVRFGEIDGLRALAIVAALIYEATRIASPSSNWPPLLGRVFADAGQGLSLFFLLSGFVLAYPALATLRVDGCTYVDVGRYLIKRFLRIYPAYLLVLALTFVVPPLAMQYGLPALAIGSSGHGFLTFVQNAFFAGSGLGNDGFRVLALEARWFVLFPAMLLLWVRLPRVFLTLTVVAALADLFFGFAHWAGIGTLVPFMLGIVAADVRAGHLRFERLAFIVLGVAALAAVVIEPFVALLPGMTGAPGALRIDAFWSVALFGLLIGAGTSSFVERFLSMRVLRMLGAASFGIALVMVPVSSFVVRQILATVGQTAAAANAALASVLVGVVVWQLTDRWFSEGNLRRDVADAAGPILDRILHLVRADRVDLGKLAMAEPQTSVYENVDPSFYAPPPRPESSDLASVSMRSGSAEDLAAEIMEMKKRLSDRSTAIFAEAEHVREPEPEPVPEVEPYSKPGFYRKPPAGSTAAGPGAEVSKPAARPAPPPPPAPKAVPNNVTPIHAYSEPQPISLSFSAPPPEPVADVPPQYQHYKLETAPVPPPAASERAAPPRAEPTPPPSRGPIKMRLGPPITEPPSINGNGKHHKVNDLDG